MRFFEITVLNVVGYLKAESRTKRGPGPEPSWPMPKDFPVLCPSGPLGACFKRPMNKPALHYSVVPDRISSQSSRHCWRSPMPHASALIPRDFGCVLGEQQTKQLPHITKVDLVWQLGV
ncbi:hypothetical protein TNCV_2116081 [Trichonephila clavipes]|nr:hypothetical protein TNCV_2116081 [Trichonephila clavipes]